MGVKHYDKAFKENAVKLSYKSVSVSQCACDLGISDSQLHKWRKSALEYGANSFLGRGNERLTDEQREIECMRKELEDSKLDLEILKKAIGYFSRADR